MSLPDEFFNPDLKRQWAQKHLQEFANRCGIIQNTNCPVISGEDDLEQGFYVIRIQHPPVDPWLFEAVLVVADFIANLRSCLDHLAWQLVIWNKGVPDIKTSFPICDGASDNSSSRKYIEKCTSGMSSDAVLIVERFQPYHAGPDYRQTPLWMLNKLWNIDKHRHFLPHTILTGWQFRVEGGVMFESEVVDHSTVFRFNLADKSKVDLNPELVPELRLFDRAEGIDIGLVEITKLYDFVTDTVLPAFSSCVPKPKS
jgi:hypothetical protein